MKDSPTPEPEPDARAAQPSGMPSNDHRATTLALWTPRGIGWASVLLGFPGAIVLAALNWRRLGRTTKAIVHLAAAVIGTWALFLVDLGLVGLVIGLAVSYYLYRVQRADQSAFIGGGRVSERSGLVGAVLALGGTIVILGSGLVVADALGSGAVSNRGQVLFGTRPGTDPCSPAGQTSTFGPSDPIYFVAVMRESVQPGSHVVYEIVGPGVMQASFPVTVAPPFDCLGTTTAMDSPGPGTYVIRYRYDGRTATSDLANGAFTVTAGQALSTTPSSQPPAAESSLSERSTTATPISTPSARTVAATAPPTSSVAGSNLPSACLPLPHEEPDLEAILPKNVAGRPLSTESYHGRLMVICVNGGSEADVADLASAAAADGLTLDDVSVAVAGRSDTRTDPPYFILAYELAGHPSDEWPPTVGLDNPDAAAFQEAEIEGKHVLVGEAAAIEQNEHGRGRPYVWNSATVHYLIVTDDMAWAAEALRALR